MWHKSNNKTMPLFTLSLEMTRLVNETRLLLVPCLIRIYTVYMCVCVCNMSLGCYHSREDSTTGVVLVVWSSVPLESVRLLSPVKSHKAWYVLTV